MATLTAAQIKAIGDAATKAAGGDTRAGAAAVAQAQAKAAKAATGSATQTNGKGGTGGAQGGYYRADNVPTGTVVKRENTTGAGLGGYAIPKNNSSPTPTPEQSRYNPLAPVPSTPATPGQHDANIKDTSAAATTAKDRVGAIGSGGSGSTGGSSSHTSGSSYVGGFSGGSYGGGSGGSSYGGASANAAQLILGLPVEAQRTALSDIQSLADLYGIDYNRDSIESVFKDATNAAHEANLKEYDRTARQYYDKLGATQNSLIDTLRKQRAASITSGANAGMQNATELSEILGLTQTVSPDALALAQDRNALIEAYNAQLAQDVRDAMEYSDQLKQALAALASEKYGYDAQQYVAELSHNANVQAQNTASSAAYTGNKYATLEDILGLAVVPSLTYTKKG